MVIQSDGTAYLNDSLPGHRRERTPDVRVPTTELAHLASLLAQAEFVHAVSVPPGGEGFTTTIDIRSPRLNLRLEFLPNRVGKRAIGRRRTLTSARRRCRIAPTSHTRRVGWPVRERQRLRSRSMRLPLHRIRAFFTSCSLLSGALYGPSVRFRQRCSVRCNDPSMRNPHTPGSDALD